MSISRSRLLMNTVSCKLLKGIRSTSTNKTQHEVANSLMLEKAPVAACPFRTTFRTVNEVIYGQTDEPIPIIHSKTKQLKSFEEIPGPKGLPIVGSLFDYFKKDGLRFNKMFEAYQARAIQYGPIYKEQIGTIKTVVISDPEEYSKVIRSEGKYPLRREMEPIAFYRRQNKMNLGLVNDQGENWYKIRTVAAPKMLKVKEVLDFCGPMNEVGNDFVHHLAQIRQSNDEIIGLEKELFKWAFESIGTFLFEARMGCFAEHTPEKAQAFIDHLREYFRCLQPLMFNVPIYRVYRTKLWREFEEHSNKVFELGRHFMDKKLAELESSDSNTSLTAKEQPEKISFLTYMLSQQSLTKDEALSTAIDLLQAATETTSNAMLWTLYCLSESPAVQEKMYEESRAVLGEAGVIDAQNIANLSYVKAVLKEALRKYPITWATSRILQEDMEVCGHHVPAGTHVQANLFGMFRDENLFPDNDSFKPERWLKEGKMDPSLKSLSNLIWGHGARMCIGRRFAEQEMHIALTKIIQNFRLKYEHETIEPTLNTVMTPDRPVVLKFIPRT